MHDENVRVLFFFMRLQCAAVGGSCVIGRVECVQSGTFVNLLHQTQELNCALLLLFLLLSS